MRKQGDYRILGWILILCLQAFVCADFARATSEFDTGRRATPSRHRNALGSYEFGDQHFHRYRFNTGFGINVMQGTALTELMQFGYAPFDGTPFYIGPEMDFSVFSPGSSLFSTLAGGWIDFPLTPFRRLNISLGAVFGPGFSANLPLPSPAFVAFGELAIDKELSELTSVRVEARPGDVGKVFAFLFDLTISFRFR